MIDEVNYKDGYLGLLLEKDSKVDVYQTIDIPTGQTVYLLRNLKEDDLWLLRNLINKVLLGDD